MISWLYGPVGGGMSIGLLFWELGGRSETLPVARKRAGGNKNAGSPPKIRREIQRFTSSRLVIHSVHLTKADENNRYDRNDVEYNTFLQGLLIESYLVAHIIL